jgi:hypothetical protein
MYLPVARENPMTPTEETGHGNGGGKAAPLHVREQQAEIRRLSEQNRALKEVERLKRLGQTVPPEVLQKAYGRIEFASAGAIRKR